MSTPPPYSLQALLLLCFPLCLPLQLLAAQMSSDQHWWSSGIASNNRHPLVQIYGLTDNHAVTALKSGQRQWSFSSELFNLSSQHHSSAYNGEDLLLDGEIQRHTASFRKSHGNGGEIAIDIPWIAHHNGFADGAIRRWHHSLGLPNGNRDERPDNTLHYRYIRNNTVALDFRQPAQGVGDIQLHYRKTLSPTYRAAISLKLPSGEQRKLTGSGSTDIGLAVTAMQPFSARQHLSWHATGAAHWLSPRGVLAQQRKRWVWQGSGGINWQRNNRHAIKLQVALQGALYHSENKALGRTAAQLLLGSSHRLGKKTVLDIYFSEDLLVDTAPDIGIGTQLRYRY